MYRHITPLYQADYELLNSSGLYKKLVSEKLLIPHTEVPVSKIPGHSDAWKILKPTPIPFVSYPYEWTFSMLKDAALLTLSIQKIALSHGMSLKDASAFNVQFLNGQPTFIDTLSFEVYEEGKPWIAYKQFIEHFLSPLLLMSKEDIRLNRLSSVFLDGIPVEITSRLLPLKTKLNLTLFIHIHAHASSQKKYSDKKLGKKMDSKKFSKRALLGMIDNLEKTIQKLSWNPKGTQWAEYYEEDHNNYKSKAFSHKGALVKEFVTAAKPKMVWDMGANTGYFSDIAREKGAEVVSFDVDYGALEKHYSDIKKHKKERIMPLFSDLTNPTPAVGWMTKERMSLFERGPADMVLALALIHHLAITHNMPFSYLAECFALMGEHLVVEYVDKPDSQVQILLANRKDIFDKYTQKDFEKEFEKHFTIKKAVPIKESKRVLYFMKRKSS